jgi:hypothetical protein
MEPWDDEYDEWKRKIKQARESAKRKEEFEPFHSPVEWQEELGEQSETAAGSQIVVLGECGGGACSPIVGDSPTTADQALACAQGILQQVIASEAGFQSNIKQIKDAIAKEWCWEYFKKHLPGNKVLLAVPCFYRAADQTDQLAAKEGGYLRAIWVSLYLEIEGNDGAGPGLIQFYPVRLFVTAVNNASKKQVVTCCNYYEQYALASTKLPWEADVGEPWLESFHLWAASTDIEVRWYLTPDCPVCEECEPCPPCPPCEEEEPPPCQPTDECPEGTHWSEETCQCVADPMFVCPACSTTDVAKMSDAKQLDCAFEILKKLVAQVDFNKDKLIDEFESEFVNYPNAKCHISVYPQSHLSKGFGSNHYNSCQDKAVGAGGVVALQVVLVGPKGAPYPVLPAATSLIFKGDQSVKDCGDAYWELAGAAITQYSSTLTLKAWQQKNYVTLDKSA